MPRNPESGAYRFNKMTIKQPTSLPNRIFFGLLLGVVIYFSLSASSGETLDARKTIMGYCTLFACALFATSLPNALIPDTLLSFHQLVNTSPTQLLRDQFSRWVPWIGSMLIPPVLVAFYEPGAWTEAIGAKLFLVIANLSTVLAMGIYSFCFYYSIGPNAQHWQEGSTGGWYDKMVAFDPRFEVPLPRGLIPALTATSRIFMTGVVVVIAQLYLARDVGLIHTLWPAFIILAWSLYKLNTLHQTFDAAYYHTNAFYREIFQRGSLRTEERIAIAYDAVYWVPHKWRSHAWMNLVQLDRVMPIGRFLTIGIVVLWVMIWQGVNTTYITSYILLLITVKNLASLVLSRQGLNPPSFQHLFQSRTDWSLTRFFINIRWTLPLFIGMISLAWLHPLFSVETAIAWTLLDILLSFAFAWTITYAVTTQSRERLHG